MKYLAALAFVAFSTVAVAGPLWTGGCSCCWKYDREVTVDHTGHDHDHQH